MKGLGGYYRYVGFGLSGAVPTCVSWKGHSGSGVRSSSGCQYTAPDSTAAAAAWSFLTLATAAWAGFPVNQVISSAFLIARLQSRWSAVKEISIVMNLVSVPSVASITRSAFRKLRSTARSRLLPAIPLRSSFLRVRTYSKPRSEAMPRASWTVRVRA